MVYETNNATIDDAVERVLAGEQLDRRDGLALIAQPVEELAAAANDVHSQFGDDTVDACSIVNAKADNCAEDCGFCAQSVHFDTGIETYGFLDPEEILAAAKRAERDGAQRFGIVVAEKGVSKERRPAEWSEVLRAIRLVRDETDVEADASLGILTEEEARILADEGVNHYNHNIETSPRYFPEIVETHSFEDRVETLRIAKNVGMDLCAGVILGMGEAPWLVVTDSVFSMDGDVAPLRELCAIVEECGAWLMVNEAHATGLYEDGGGIIQHEGLSNRIHVQMGTLSKALASQGGYVAGSEDLIEHLFNTARSFVFSTGLAPPAAAAAREAFHIARDGDRPAQLWENVEHLREGLTDIGYEIRGETQILPVIVGDREDTIALDRRLCERSVVAPGIRPPTVPEGTSRIRVAPMASHTDEDIDHCLAAFREAGSDLNLL